MDDSGSGASVTRYGGQNTRREVYERSTNGGVIEPTGGITAGQDPSVVGEGLAVRGTGSRLREERPR